MSPYNEITDILDEMKDSRVFTDTIKLGQPKKIEFIVKNLLWIFTYDGGVEMTVECDTGTLGSYWSVLAEHDIIFRSVDRGGAYHRQLEKTFSSSRKFSFDLLRNFESRKTLEIKTTVLKIEDLYRFPRFDHLQNLSNESSSAVLSVGGRQIRINKQYLSTHSPVFEAMFNSEFAEKNLAVIPIKNTTFNGFIEFLRVLHFRHSFETRDSVVFDALKLADLYQVPWIVEFCENRLVSLESNPRPISIHPDQTINKLKGADDYKLNSYQRAILVSLSQNDLHDIIQNSTFPELSMITQLAVYRKYHSL